jgi:hypothetical protein
VPPDFDQLLEVRVGGTVERAPDLLHVTLDPRPNRPQERLGVGEVARCSGSGQALRFAVEREIYCAAGELAGEGFPPRRHCPRPAPGEARGGLRKGFKAQRNFPDPARPRPAGSAPANTRPGTSEGSAHLQVSLHPVDTMCLVTFPLARTDVELVREVPDALKPRQIAIMGAKAA